jgi:CBS domain-containing protein
MQPVAASRRRRLHRRAPHRAPRLVELPPTTSITDAISRMQAAGQALALVVRGPHVVGVVDLEDLRFARDWAGARAVVGDAVTMHVTERAATPTARDVRPY